MESTVHIQHTFSDPCLQGILEEKAKILLQGPLKEKSEYAQEKALKSFAEGLLYLNESLLLRRGVHGSQLKPEVIMGNEKEFIAKQEEVRSIMQTEIDRQFRHYISFL